MKTKIIIPAIILSLVLLTKSVFAQNTTPTGTPREVRNQIKETRQETKTTANQIKEEKQLLLSELKIKRSEAVYKAIKMGLTKRHAALLKIKAKLDARISKNPMKKDTAGAVEKLKSFGAIEITYNNHLAILDSKFNEIKSSSTKVSNLIVELKIVTNTIREDLNNMKTILKEATVLLAQAPKLEVEKETE